MNKLKIQKRYIVLHSSWSLPPDLHSPRCINFSSPTLQTYLAISLKYFVDVFSFSVYT